MRVQHEFTEYDAVIKFNSSTLLKQFLLLTRFHIQLLIHIVLHRITSF